jgi:hypothetical protein
MKIPKCPKTVTGKHMWRYNAIEIRDKWVRSDKCDACGLIDDRPQKKGDNREERN